MKRDRFGNQQQQEIPPPPPPKPQRRQQQQEEEIPPPPPPRTQRQQQQQQQQEQQQDIPPPPPPRVKQHQQQQQEEEVPPPPPPRPRPSSASLRVGGVILGANGSSSSPAVAYLPTTAVASGSPTSPPAVYLPTIALANGSSSSPPAVYLPSTAIANGSASSPAVVHLPATAVTNGSLSSPPAAYLPTTTVAWNVPGMNSGGDGDGGGGGVANVFSSSSGISLPSSTLAPADQGNDNTGAASKRSKRGVAEFDGWRAKADEILVKAGRGGGGGGGGAQAWDSKARIGRVAGREDGDGRMNGGQSKTTVAASAMTPRSKRRFAVVCSANFNRSMMAHKLLRENSFQVESYGTGREVRLPGKDVSSPEVFPFGTPYRDIYDTLKGKDEQFFLQNNLLPLVARNATIKAAPERFQEIEGTDMAGFDVVLCFESRVFYLVVEDLQSRDPETFKPLHVVNMSIKDSFEESAAAADNVLELCRTACLLVPKNKVIGIIHSARLDGLFRLEDEAADVLEAFTRKTKRTVLHQVCHV